MVRIRFLMLVGLLAIIKLEIPSISGADFLLHFFRAWSNSALDMVSSSAELASG